MKKATILLLSILLQSCYSLKPDSRALSSKDYNDRQTITNPILVKKRNPIGVTFNIVTPLAAGAAMYQYTNPVVKYQDGSETKGFKPANAAIGVLGMLAINKIVDYTMGYNKPHNLNEKSLEKWIEKTKLKKTNNLLTNEYYTELKLIPKIKESNFEVRNINDVEEFKLLFPEATNENVTALVTKATLVLENDDLVSLVNFYPDNSASYLAKVKFVEKSRTYEELWDRVNKYPEAKVDAELLASELVDNGNNLVDFLNKYPTSTYLDKTKVYSFKNIYLHPIISNATLISNNVFNIDEVTFKRYFKNDITIINNYFDAVFDFKKVNSLSEIAFFYSEKNWLTKLVSSTNKLEKAWNVGYNEFENGDDLVYLLKTFNSYNWNISPSEIENFIDGKLQSIVKNSLSIKNINSKRSTNDDMERFRNSEYAPFMVTTEGVIHYLMYGDLINTSKFSLPVKVNSTSNLKLMLEGGLATLQKWVMNFATNTIGGETYKPVGILKNSYLVGYIRPYETKKFAIKYELDGGLEKATDFAPTGWLFSMQYAEKVKLDNHKFDIVYSKEYLSEDLIQKQNSWLYFIDNNLPKVDMLDKVRGISYTESEVIMAEKAEKIKEENRRAAEELRKQEQFNKENSLVLDSNNSNYELKVFQEIEKQNTIQIYTKDNDDYNCCYSSIIYNKDNKKIKEFSNNGNDDNSRDDNFVNINNYDFPVRVDVKYLHDKKEYVTFSVALSKGAEIIVKPKKK